MNGDDEIKENLHCESCFLNLGRLVRERESMVRRREFPFAYLKFFPETMIKVGVPGSKPCTRV
jgi:hypothetical protein